MKKTVHLCLIACLLLAWAETACGLDERCWSRIRGDIDYNYVGAAAATTGRVYVVGTTETSFDGETLPGLKGGVLMAFSDDGNHTWTRIFGPVDGHARAYGVAVGPTGLVYVTGQVWQDMDGESAIGNGDQFVKVFDAAGSNVWTRIFGSASIDAGLAIAVDAQEQIYVAGYAANNFNGEVTHAGGNDFSLTALAADGEMRWARIWGSTAHDYGHAVTVADTNLYVAGYASGAVDSQPFGGTTDAALFAFDSDGNKRWSRLWGGTGVQRAYAVVTDATGAVCISGYGGSFNGQTSVGSTDPFLLKTDAGGNLKWTRLWGSTGDDLCFGLAMDAQGLLYTTGHAAYNASFDGQASYLGGVFLTCHDSDGDRKWSQRWGSGSTEGWSAVAQDGDLLYVGGSTYGGFDGQSGGDNHDWLFVSQWGSYGPPEITAGPFSGGIEEASATVSWNLNREAVGWVDYSRFLNIWEGTATNLQSTQAHVVPLSGLSAGSTYCYQVRAEAADGQAVTSAVHYFSTTLSQGIGNVDQEIMGRSFNPAQVTASSTGDVDRIEMRVNDGLLCTWYGDEANFYLDENTPGIARGTNRVDAVGIRADGGTTGMCEGFWTLDNDGVPTRCEIEAPWTGYALQIEGSNAPATSVLLRVLAARQETRVVDLSGLGPFGGGSGRIIMDWAPVSNVHFYVNGDLVHTSIEATAVVGGSRLYHEYEYPVTGLATGVYRVNATFTPPAGYRRSSDSRSFRIEPFQSDVVAWREVDFSEEGNSLFVTVNLFNRGTGAATINLIEDHLTGLQGTRVQSGWENSNIQVFYDDTANRSSVCVQPDPATCTLPAGVTAQITFHAIPILYPDTREIQIGGTGRVTGHDTLNEPFEIALDEITHSVGPWGSRMPLVDAVAQCVRQADYLLVSSPVNLNGVFGYEASGSILATMGELASYRNGVLGYFHAANRLDTRYRSGDPVALGMTYRIWEENDQIVLADISANTVHAYSSVREITDESIPAPVCADVRAGDALAAGNYLRYDLDGDIHPRDEWALARGANHDTAAGTIEIFQYRPGSDMYVFRSFSSSPTVYDTGGAILTGKFSSSTTNDLLAVIDPTGLIQFACVHDNSVELFSISSIGYNAPDLIACGNVRGGNSDEIILAATDIDRVCLYAQYVDSTEIPKIYTLQDSFRRTVNPDDAIAVGDVLGEGHDEIIYADATADELVVYRYDAAIYDFVEVYRMDLVFNAGDWIGVGRVGTRTKEQVIVLRGSNHDGESAGTALMFQLCDADVPGDRNALDDLLDEGGLWAAQLAPDWARQGHLLLVGETEIIPAFKSTWEFYDANHTVHFHDREYANTRDAISKPELATGRIPGNDPATIIQAMQTSINIAKGISRLCPYSALCVAGDDEFDRFEGRRNSIATKLLLAGFLNIDSQRNTDVTNTIVSAGGRNVIFLAGHGNYWKWDGITTDEIAAHYVSNGYCPLVFASSCLTGRYPNGTALPEQFLTMEASAFIGATETTYGDPNGGFANSFFSRIRADYTLGEALKYTKRHWGDTSAGGSPEQRRRNRYHCAAYHFFGDPKLGFEFDKAKSTHMASLQSAMEEEEPDYQGPLDTLLLNIPMYAVEQFQGHDIITLPEQAQVVVSGKPIVPQYAVSIAFPNACCIQNVRLVKRGEAQIIQGLSPAIATDDIDGIAPTGGLEEIGGGLWPDRIFDWEIENSLDDQQRLTLVMYPFYHDANTQISTFYTHYEFAIDYAWSPLQITAIEPDRATYTNGQRMVASVYLHATNAAPMNVVLHAQIARESDDAPTPLPLRILRDLQGWAGCHLDWELNLKAAGDYRLDVAAMAENNVVLDRASVTFQFGEARAALRDFGISPEIPALNGNAQLSVVLDNTGATTLDGLVHFLIQDAAGNTVAHLEQAFSAVNAGASVTLTVHWQGVTLLPRNTCIVVYAVYGDSVSAMQVAADGGDAPLLFDALTYEAGSMTLRWPSKAGHHYALYASDNLLDGFTLAIPDISATPPYNSHPLTTLTGTRFFKIVESPAP